MSILGIEIGTTRCVAVAYALDGQVVGRAHCDYPLHHPVPGAMELDADQVMDRVRQAIAEVATQVGDRDPVRTICTASQGETVVPVDAQGRALAPALTTFDRRPQPEAAWWDATVGREHVQAITGLASHPMYSLCKVLWWMRTRPEMLRTARYLLGVDALFLQRLGLPPTTDFSMAGRTMGLDLQAKAWSTELLKYAGASPEQFPALVPAGTPIGTLQSAVARQYGLPDDVTVVVGGHDQACAALACGVIKPGTAMDASGAVECMAPVLDAPVTNADMLDGFYGCYPHVVPDRYLTLAFNFTAGSLLRWYRDTLGEVEETEATASGLSFYEILLGKASSGPSGILVLPHFTMTGTPWMDPHARGAIVGLTLMTSKAHLIAGLLEGMTYEMRLNLERLQTAGVPVDLLRVVGGGATLPAWLQLRANILQRPVEGVELPDASCRGAGLLAGVATGVYTDLTDAVARTFPACRCYLPEAGVAEGYTREYELYTRLYPALQPIVHAM